MSGSAYGRIDRTLARIVIEESQEDEQVVGESHGICFAIYPF